jgi:DNA excision repair protein ERCC-5
MGVTGLWTVVHPCARPIKLETLNRKRLAVDASIWIYQFLKAVRDKEGNALRNSHVVGFFRRICKLLYFGIKPVFVFDGGAPALKRSTIAGRKRRREGRREDAVRTAGRLLAVQMKKRAEEEEAKAREAQHERAEREEEIREEELIYVDEIGMSERERKQNRKFKKTDQYHLPELETSSSEMGAPNDPRVMSQEELEDYARQFHSGENINLYDFSKIDFDSPFFLSLPASDRYNILNAARLRSRLRMGLSKEQLDKMFPDRMAFSRFQIERVKERNMYTQRLMKISGMDGIDGTLGENTGGRIVGEKGREYVLVKNDGVEGGWALGVVSNKDGGKQTKPIDVDEYSQEPKTEDDDEEWEDEEGFEDVPIEGLNRLPKLSQGLRDPLDYDEAYRAQEIADKRRAVYEARRQANELQLDQEMVDDDLDTLFIADPEARDTDKIDGLFEDRDEDKDLRRAIAMSLEKPEDNDEASRLENAAGPANKATNSGPIQSSRDIAMKANPKAKRSTMFDLDDDDDDFDLQAALAESRKSKHQSKDSHELARPRSPNHTSPSKAISSTQKDHPFSGPLPFESLDLGTSMLGKKKKKLDEDFAGGFEREEAAKEKKEAPKPLPPWFAGEQHRETLFPTQTQANQQDDELGVEDDERFNHRILNRIDTGEIIFVDSQTKEVIDIDSDDDKTKEKESVVIDDVADLVRAEPPVSKNANAPEPTTATSTSDVADEPSDDDFYEWEASDHEEPSKPNNDTLSVLKRTEPSPSKSPSPEFENVDIPNSAPNPPHLPKSPQLDDLDETLLNDSTYNPTDTLITEDNLDPSMDEFSDPEDEELMAALATEAEEHARFAASLSQTTTTPFDYETELKQLRTQQRKDRRDADEVSHIMITECQALLRLFGLPYITAPMEAEAQCAELVSLGLVDGVVTDDSDIFLFGGTRVYKNFFNQGKFVECYLSSDLEKEYALTRRKLIHFAHLLGSDYTDGLAGVGPVTALEILSEFPSLSNFVEWWSQIQFSPKNPDLLTTPFRKKFAKNTTKLFLPPSFPDPRVDIAYLEPEVDSDPQPFQWGVPDLDALRQFLMSTIGWSQERTDEVLVPVIRDMNRREREGTQSNITGYFTGGSGAGAFAPRAREARGGRMERAFGRLRGQAERGKRRNDDIAPKTTTAASSSETGRKKRKAKVGARGEKTKAKKTSRKKRPSRLSEGTDDGVSVEYSEMATNDDDDDDDDGIDEIDDREPEVDDDDNNDDEAYEAPQTKRKRKRVAGSMGKKKGTS